MYVYLKLLIDVNYFEHQYCKRVDNLSIFS